MHEHGSDELMGPIRGTPGWWQGMGAKDDLQEEAAPTPQETKKKRKPAKARGIRQDLVDRVRAEIAAGTYETPEKWEAALDCLLDGLDRHP